MYIKNKRIKKNIYRIKEYKEYKKSTKNKRIKKYI